MLRRILNGNEFEYEIQYTTNEIEYKFYEYFLEYIKRINFDIDEYQIIVNPIKHRIEIRIRMGKLHKCFGGWFDLDDLYKYPKERVNYASSYICDAVVQQVQDYVKSLCFKD